LALFLSDAKIMPIMKACITGVAGYLPPDKLTNADLERMVETNDAWITDRTGIKERRILKTPGWASSDMASEAVKTLLAKTGTNPDEIELLICATVTGDMVFPDTANTIMDKIGAKNGYGYDINAACSGFLFALTTGAQFIASGMHKKVVVVGVDMMSSIIDYQDRATCIIFGDGAGAVLLEPSVEGYGIEDQLLRGDGSGRQYLHMKAGGSLHPATHETVDSRMHYAYQEGKRVFKYAVEGMVDVCKQVMERNQLSSEDVQWVVPHQANMRIITSVAGYLDVPMERVMVNIENYGNTTAGTLPLCLRDYEHLLRKGDKVILTAFGGGFTWGAIYLTWGYDSVL
jgi:3-oxoacyl-[acyl-carrier-protein] synthase III